VKRNGYSETKRTNHAMSWYRVTLSADDLIYGRGPILKDEFMTSYIRSPGSREDAVMLTPGSRIPSGTPYYFSPGAVRIARSIILRWGGKECAGPTSPEGLVKLVGGETWRTTVFSSESAGTQLQPNLRVDSHGRRLSLSRAVFHSL
jgi:hypothetical protein